MNVIDLKENEDGSANIELELDNKELVALVELGFTQLILNYIEASNEKH